MLEKQPITFNALAIGIIWVFHLSGIVGILYVDSQWFVGATPINLTLSFSLLLLTSRREKKALIVAIIAFITGMIAEGLGVNYGLIFGHYNYGDALGMKIYGVPWLIGANWSIFNIMLWRHSYRFNRSVFFKGFTGCRFDAVARFCYRTHCTNFRFLGI